MPGNAAAWMVHGPGCFSRPVVDVKRRERNTIGKHQCSCAETTGRGASPQTKGRTAKPSSKKSTGSKSRKRHRCVRLKKADGPTPTVTWETDGAWHTAFLTLGTGASPNEGQESFLSQILQADVPQRFYLSRKACLGILRRASARGKALPEILKKALEQQAERMREDGDGSS